MHTNKVVLVEKELSYKIVGIVYDAYNQLNFGFQERYYQRAFAQLLEKNRLRYKKELAHPITLKDEEKIIGRYLVDFLIENRVVVEWKVANDFYESHINQVLAYLKTGGYRLGLIALVTPQGVKIKRLVN